MALTSLLNKSRTNVIMSLFLVMVMASCVQSPARPENEQKKTTESLESHSPSFNLSPPPISQFIRRIYQDRKGNLWLGTNGDGVFMYDQDTLHNFKPSNEFDGYAVRAIKEDQNGLLWFATSNGLISYDGNDFETYSIATSEVADDLWSLHIDDDGLLWVGSCEGLSIFNGTSFTRFIGIPETPEDFTRGVSSKYIIHDIMQDRTGKKWFATNGGVFIYDGENLSDLSEENGLCNNAVNDIIEDRSGNIWFATHHNGICRWDGNSFTHFSKQDGIRNTEAWSLFEDQAGNIWFPIENDGIYKYDGTSFTNYGTQDGLPSLAIQTIYEDRSGVLWIGGYQGLARFHQDHFIYVSALGPWE